MQVSLGERRGEAVAGGQEAVGETVVLGLIELAAEVGQEHTHRAILPMFAAFLSRERADMHSDL